VQHASSPILFRPFANVMAPALCTLASLRAARPCASATRVALLLTLPAVLVGSVLLYGGHVASVGWLRAPKTATTAAAAAAAVAPIPPWPVSRDTVAAAADSAEAAADPVEAAADSAQAADDDLVDLAGHDCAALGRRAEPAWVNRSAMAESVPDFLSLYARRRVADNAGGMRADHSFGLYTVVRALRPAVFIESGVFKAHSSWLVSATLPGTRIISIDPSAGACEAARAGIRLAGGDPAVTLTCLTGEAFADFSEVDWDALLSANTSLPDVRAVRAATLVLMDDHMAGPRRLAEVALRGFSHVLFDDNYAPTMRGDNYSIKQACARGAAARAAWSGAAPDRFGRIRTGRLPWERHVALGDAMTALMSEYWEVPPLGAPELTQQTRASVAEMAPAVVSDAGVWRETGLGAMTAAEFGVYTHMAYVKLQ